MPASFSWFERIQLPGAACPPRRPLALANEFQIARFLILRLLGVVYAAGFLIVILQGPALIGERGLSPAPQYLEMLQERHVSFAEVPTVFWLNASDGMLLAVGWLGLVLSLAVVAGYANALIMIVLWALYLSVVHVGQLFWSYGWENQLVETGFLAIFLVPLLKGKPFPRAGASKLVLWLFRWLIARVMLGAGLIKLRGEEVWHWDQLSALFYHFETQPVPNGLSWAFHHLPKPVLQGGVVVNHVVELLVPILILLPRPVRNAAGAIMILFQVSLIVSGNLSFLNYLTIIPCFACIDDRFFRRWLPVTWWRKIREREVERSGHWLRVALVAVSIFLAWQPIANLLELHGRQRMNATYNSLSYMGSYGAFGSVGQGTPNHGRLEIVIEGTDSPDPNNRWAKWREYQFHGKPGDPQHAPPNYAPYHRRLDWQMWFAAPYNYQSQGWLVVFARKLLEGDPQAAKLLRENPFPDRPPRYLRMTVYVYRFTTPEERRATRAWWVRAPSHVFLPPVGLGNFSQPP